MPDKAQPQARLSSGRNLVPATMRPAVSAVKTMLPPDHCDGMADPLSVTASVIAVAGLAVKSCQGLFRLVNQFENGPRQLGHHLHSLRILKSIFATIEALEPSAVPAELLTRDFRSRLQDCIRDLKEFEKFAGSLQRQFEAGQGRRVWSRAKWALGDRRQTLESHLERIQMHVQIFSLDLSLFNVLVPAQSSFP
jgi:hypothetical protein